MNLSLQRKSSSRLAAVQCLYQTSLTGEVPTADTYLTQYEDHKQSGEHWPPNAPPDKAFLSKLLAAAQENSAALDALIDGGLQAGWTRERMSPLLLSVLRAGLTELRFFGKLNPAIVIDEYTTLAHRFLNEDEAAFVHAMLGSLAIRDHA